MSSCSCCQNLATVALAEQDGGITSLALADTNTDTTAALSPATKEAIKDASAAPNPAASATSATNASVYSNSRRQSTRSICNDNCCDAEFCPGPAEAALRTCHSAADNRADVAYIPEKLAGAASGALITASCCVSSSEADNVVINDSIEASPANEGPGLLFNEKQEYCGRTCEKPTPTPVLTQRKQHASASEIPQSHPCTCCTGTSQPSQALGIPKPQDLEKPENLTVCTDSCCPPQTVLSHPLEDGEDHCLQIGKFDDWEKTDEETVCDCCVEQMLSPISVASSNISAFLVRLENGLRQLRKCCAAVQRRCCALDREICCSDTTCWKTETTDKPKTQQKSLTLAHNAVASREMHVQEPTTTIVQLHLGGMDCPDCLKYVKLAIERLPGVQLVSLDYVSASATIRGTFEHAPPEAVARFVSQFTGFDVRLNNFHAGDSNTLILPIVFDNDVPPNSLISALGVDLVPREGTNGRNVLKNRSTSGNKSETFEIYIPISSDPHAVQTPREIMDQLAPYGARLLPPQKAGQAGTRDLQMCALRTGALAALTLPILVMAWGELPRRHPMASRWAQFGLATAVQALGWPLFKTSIRVLWYLRSPDLGLLATLSTCLSYIFSVIALAFHATGHAFADPVFETSALLLTLIFAGKTIQFATRQAVGNAIDKLSDLQIAETGLFIDPTDKSKVQLIDVRLLQVGDIIRAPPHSRIPSDGVVVKGLSAVDEATVTGESVPAEKDIGSIVLAGSLNLQGALEVQVSRMTHENSLATVASLVRLAQASRTKLQDLADKLAKAILPVALFVSVASFVVWLLVNRKIRGRSWGDSVASSFSYAIAVMASSCPCALALAIPFPATTAIIAGARAGVLFRHIDALTMAGRADLFAFDKTGTLSQGVLRVIEAQFVHVNAKDITRRLAAASAHPISASVLSHSMKEGLPVDHEHQLAQLADIVSVPGAGVQAQLQIGNFTFMVRGGSASFTKSASHPLVQQFMQAGYSIYTVSIDATVIAVFGLTDVEREEVKGLMLDLQSTRKELALISGDHHSAVRAFATKIGIGPTRTYAECTPAAKAQIISTLKAETGKTICFVGDGVNDSIALSSADVSVTISKGAQIALTSSGVILRGTNLRTDIETMMEVSKLYKWASYAALGWCTLYFTVAILLAAGVAVNFRITPQIAAFSEIISVGPVLLIGTAVFPARRFTSSRKSIRAD